MLNSGEVTTVWIIARDILLLSSSKILFYLLFQIIYVILFLYRRIRTRSLISDSKSYYLFTSELQILLVKVWVALRISFWVWVLLIRIWVTLCSFTHEWALKYLPIILHGHISSTSVSTNCLHVADSHWHSGRYEITFQKNIRDAPVFTDDYCWQWMQILLWTEYKMASLEINFTSDKDSFHVLN